jgi:hypothetical protein
VAAVVLDQRVKLLQEVAPEEGGLGDGGGEDAPALELGIGALDGRHGAARGVVEPQLGVAEAGALGRRRT